MANKNHEEKKKVIPKSDDNKSKRAEDPIPETEEELDETIEDTFPASDATAQY